IHVLIRLALLIGVGTLGFSSIYWLLYLAVPALVTGYILQDGGDAYLAKAGPRLVPVLRWLAGGYAYLWLLTDVLPPTGAGGAVELEVETGGPPTPAGALSRLLLSVPALLLAALLSLAAAIVWLVAAVAVLISERVPPALSDFLTMALRYQ